MSVFQLKFLEMNSNIRENVNYLRLYRDVIPQKYIENPTLLHTLNYNDNNLITILPIE